MRFDLLFVNRHRLLMPFDSAARVLSSAIKRSYSQHATQSLPHPQNTSPPPAKRRRGAASSGVPSPFSSAHSTSKHFKLATRPPRSFEPGPSSSPRQPSFISVKRKKKKPVVQPKTVLPGPYHNEAYIVKEHNKAVVALKRFHKETPKSSLNNFYQALNGNGKLPKFTSIDGEIVEGKNRIYAHRTTVELDIDPPIIGVGDHQDKKRSMHLAALSAVYQLHHLGILEDSKKLKPPKTDETEVVLSDGSSIDFVKARAFMDYYCRRYGFGKFDTEVSLNGSNWETVMIVGGRRIGLGSGQNKKASQTACFLDVTKYLESCDPELWKAYVEAAKTGADLGLAPKVALSISPVVEDAITDLCADIRKTSLYRNRPSQEPFALRVGGTTSQNHNSPNRPFFQRNLLPKSQRLLEGRKAYLADPKLERIRSTRMSLPVYSRRKEVLDHITNNDVTICMAATGSGKTTQIPQMILDEYIDRGEGANCNIICTQPRRLAAISVADRVAKERGEALGRSIGYHVRFDAKLPLPDGSVTFCTTGVFLKQLQSYLSEHERSRTMDAVTHIVVDEVHERDIDTDLLLVVLKQILAQKKANNQSLKIVLMSATIDPTLFQNYFANESGVPAKTFTVPGRSFPVNKYFLDDYVSQISQGPSQWILREDNVAKYLHYQLGPVAAASLGIRVFRPDSRDDELDLPYPFIAATIGHVLESSQDGHVLVFLPGWDDIMATQKALLFPPARHAVPFNDTSKYSIHLLHSTIPLAEQQAIFEPPTEGVRRIILATNIAETSITIPDVVYVIDTAKIKEQRYDPDRRISSLVTAWVGSSNLNQRAGRAGRHRPGEYYGILSKANADRLNPYQTVEMKRADLSNVVMHVKALNFSGLSVEEVLAAAIEAPDPSRVTAALNDLHMVGALDSAKNLTSLGRVLVQLPMDAYLGRLVLYGSFFKCLDQALTLAAILANRDPFMSPMHLKVDAARRKNSWCHEDFRSDALTVLKAFDAWSEMQSRGEYNAANRFCIDNFLSKPTLLLIQKIKGQVLQSLYRTGVIDVSAGGQVDGSSYDGSMKTLKVPPALDKNRNSFPLLVALIAIASQPRFGVRVGEKTYRTSNDRNALIHPSSVNHRRREVTEDQADEKQLYAFADKRRNESTGSSATTFLVTTTRLDPLTYILFGAHNVDVVERGLECDNWLPIVGDVNILDDIQRLKTFMEASMLRVFEGIAMRGLRKGQALPVRPREEESESESWDEEDSKKNYSLSPQEVRELDYMTRDVVNILNRHNADRIANQSRQQSRAATPLVSPSWQNSRLPGGSVSGYSTPNHFYSRPGTPSRLRYQKV